jgi:hypothetical protein
LACPNTHSAPIGDFKDGKFHGSVFSATLFEQLKKTKGDNTLSVTVKDLFTTRPVQIVEPKSEDELPKSDHYETFDLTVERVHKSLKVNVNKELQVSGNMHLALLVYHFLI